jgi:hypothetical protein
MRLEGRWCLGFLLRFLFPAADFLHSSSTNPRNRVKMSGSLSIALIQTCSANNKAVNLRKTALLVAQAVRASPKLQLVCLVRKY